MNWQDNIGGALGRVADGIGEFPVSFCGRIVFGRSPRKIGLLMVFLVPIDLPPDVNTMRAIVKTADYLGFANQSS